MRGLTAEEVAFVKSQDRPCRGASAPEFTTGEESMARRLVGRGLLAWEDCPAHAGRHVTPTAAGRTLVFVYDQMMAMHGSP